jgi:hypothetical protein
VYGAKKDAAAEQISLAFAHFASDTTRAVNRLAETVMRKPYWLLLCSSVGGCLVLSVAACETTTPAPSEMDDTSVSDEPTLSNSSETDDTSVNSEPTVGPSPSETENTDVNDEPTVVASSTETDDTATSDEPTLAASSSETEDTIEPPLQADAGEPEGEPTAAPWALPPGNAPFDYQIGGAYEPPAGVLVVSRDREAPIAPGLYNICYVNGFQTQPQDNESWLTEHPELLLQDGNGEPILDEDWGEYLFDISTPEKRTALLEIVTPWLEGCEAAGFDAIEIDNLDSYSRSDGALNEDAAVAYMAELSKKAHELGLAIGQKNSAELLSRAAELDTDFAIAEECNRYEECADYQEVYGDLVFVIEYREQDFSAGCAAHPELSIVLRDLDVSSPGSNSYVFDGC